ncbi:RNA methyltransferase [Cyanobacterium aponinum AL20118]|nr:RNA methyltransferase [Cyanobacterium aponinum]MBD2395701.1 RNA methyltransferase [Cyanobacterium aponinum FACHB-4101]MTF39333.1 TrmJ/YjtD family RNA methyltransferase [Cyanobacterium aponinum 0216]PHV63403.1 RNA methyltransferase [Cyanobacterium aponinum IPPAS B-1201]WPF88334.1 RNA methyltransferase [Cyanobacterium aponinum AL20115]WRL39955.1 RNA methyltransferase [Cyanobacterium aponinum UTEX 3221]
MTVIDSVRIVLVEPAGERNIGSIARVMRNMGLTKLVIVNPHCNPLSEEAKVMAVHGVEVLEKAKIVNSIPSALQGCQRAIATTARERGIPTPLEKPRDVMGWLLEENINSALVFGPEDRGLSNQELSYAQRFVCIPSNPEYPSLNLAQAVGVCAYELYQEFLNQNQKTVIDTETEKQDDLADLKALEGYYQHLESVLLQVNYLYPHTAKATMEKIKRIVNRSDLKTQELAMLRGMLRQVEWGIKSHTLED